MNGFNNDEFQKYIFVFLYMMRENKQASIYFATPVVLDFKIVNGNVEVKHLDKLLDNSVSPQMNCIKILHRLSMIYAYVVSYMTEHHLDFNKINVDINKKYSLLLAIGNENVNVVNYKGFGFLCSNVKAFAWALNKSLDVLFNYVKQLSSENEKYYYLKKVVDYWSKNQNINPDISIVRFIQSNQDFYKNEILQSQNLS